MNKPLIMLGAGGHASVLVDVLRSQGRVPFALAAPTLDETRCALSCIEFWNDESQILDYDPNDVELINGIGSLPGNFLRAQLFARYHALGYRFAQVISKQAMISDYAVLDEGVQVMSGAIIQAGTRIGQNSIINTGAILDHDCHINRNNHIAPGVVLSGGVVTGEGVHIGTGASVIQSVSIGAYSVVGAGATLTRNLNENQIIYAARGSVMPIKQ